jgi:hypothetical protein
MGNDVSRDDYPKVNSCQEKLICLTIHQRWTPILTEQKATHNFAQVYHNEIAFFIKDKSNFVN